MISRCIVFLVGAVALAGCCVSGNGCYAPVLGAPTAPIAWDGLGSPPTETADVPENRPKKTTRPKKEIIVGPIGDDKVLSNHSSTIAGMPSVDGVDWKHSKKQVLPAHEAMLPLPSVIVWILPSGSKRVAVLPTRYISHS